MSQFHISKVSFRIYSMIWRSLCRNRSGEIDLDRHRIVPKKMADPIVVHRQHRHPILAAFPVAYHDLVARERDILHPQPQAFQCHLAVGQNDRDRHRRMMPVLITVSRSLRFAAPTL